MKITLTLQTGARGVALSRNGKRLGMLYVLPGSLAEFAHTNGGAMGAGLAGAGYCHALGNY